MYGEFGAMRFPLQHPMVRWLIHDKFSWTPSLSRCMTRIPSSIYKVRESAQRVRADLFDFDLTLASAKEPHDL